MVINTLKHNDFEARVGHLTRTKKILKCLKKSLYYFLIQGTILTHIKINYYLKIFKKFVTKY